MLIFYLTIILILSILSAYLISSKLLDDKIRNEKINEIIQKLNNNENIINVMTEIHLLEADTLEKEINKELRMNRRFEDE